MTLYEGKKIDKQEELNPKVVETATFSTAEVPLNELPDFSNLTLIQRQAIEMRYFEELSFNEIPRKLDTSPSSVRQMGSRTIRSLKKLAKKKKTQYD